MKTLTIRRPDDWHLHLRDGAALEAVAPATAAVFGRALESSSRAHQPAHLSAVEKCGTGDGASAQRGKRSDQAYEHIHLTLRR